MMNVPQRRKQRTNRQDSNVFSMFNEMQILAFKEVFDNIDKNEDRAICESDLKKSFALLGQNVSNETIQDMMSEGKGERIEFAMFLAMMAEKLGDRDSDEKILEALSVFEEDGKQTIDAAYLRECMTTMGDHFSQHEADMLFSGVKVDNQGQFYSNEFVSLLKHGE